VNPLPARPAAATLPLAERLRSNLAAQQAAAETLSDLAACERERLLARDWDAILRLCEDKHAQVQRLQTLARELDALCAGQPVAEVMAAQALSEPYGRLLERAAQLQRANREARALLDHHQARVGTALRLLKRGDSTGLYGRNGHAGAPGSLRQRLASA
jgi:flagellar biosynthesis/type III secretory pathway chaperone